MCRWLAYSGTPVLLDELLYKPSHSLIDQSLHSRLGVETTNGDGFGVGWYGESGRARRVQEHRAGMEQPQPARARRHIRSGLVFAHIRASTGTPVQQTNCHPFRHGHWLWMHNGSITGFHDVKRDLVLAVDPHSILEMEGSTDSETFFFLALTFGLEDDPPGAVAQAVGHIEDVGQQARDRVPDPDDGRHDRRRNGVGLPLLERGRVALAVFDTVEQLREQHPRWQSCRRSPTRRASSSPSRSATSPAPGTRSPRRARASCIRDRTSCIPSGLALPSERDCRRGKRPGGSTSALTAFRRSPCA